MNKFGGVFHVYHETHLITFFVQFLGSYLINLKSNLIQLGKLKNCLNLGWTTYLHPSRFCVF